MITICDPNTLVVFNYQIINAGHPNEKDVKDGLKAGGAALINTSGDILAASVEEFGALLLEVP